MAPEQQSFGSGGANFPTTHWGLFSAVREGQSAEKHTALNALVRQYWKPAYCFVRARGFREEEAKDLTQQFFISWLEHESFTKADRTIGRFRSFLLKSLKNFLSNAHRRESAQRRRPAGGFVSIDELEAHVQELIGPVDADTPEVIFNRTWAIGQITAALQILERECLQKHKETYLELFRQRVVDPILHGAPVSDLGELAHAHGLTKKEASNRVVTMRRACQRVLREQLKQSAASDEELTDELNDLFKILEAP